MRFDTIISGGTVHTAESSFVADVGVEKGLIAAIAAPGSLSSPGARVIDASGKHVIPGAIDVHVHLALPFCGTVSCDDFEHGSRAAVHSGITTVIDFAIPSKGESLKDAHETWMAKARGKSLVDFSWHMALTDRGHIEEIPELVEMGLPTFKEFMIYESEGWNSDDAMLYATLEKVRSLSNREDEPRAMLLLHAESPRILDLFIGRHHTPEKMKALGARLHAITRPNVVEAEAIERAIRFAEHTRGALYIVHMSTGEGTDLVKAARARGVPVLAETCAQYLVLDDSVFERSDGHLYACCPQVKKAGDIDRLWRGLGDGEVCVVSTDTCSFTREQKAMWNGDFTKIPMGLPGLDTMVPIVYTFGVQAGRITMNRLVQLCCTNPARVMGLGDRKGTIAPGFDADLAIIDPAASLTVDPKSLYSKADWSPYQGMTLHGFSSLTMVRGTVVYENGKHVGTPGHGQFVSRSGPGRLN
ncbi:MAG: dihydropyrimidinase [Phycisphaerales bacterium]|nr:MAG: dihydropyrimidinase [Phycisphaerales bacterium]